MKKVLFTAIIASSLFACSKQEVMDKGEIKGENTVSLTIKQTTPTKGVSDQKGATEYAVIGSATIFFLNSSDVNIYQRDLTTLEIADLANTQSSAGGNTVVITGVPSTATSLYFIANIQTSASPLFPSADGLTSSDARLRIDKLQTNAINVPMAGKSTDPFNLTSPNKYSAAVTITPLVARLEVGRVTCVNQNGAMAPAVSADITGYKLSGVFINNIRKSVLLSGLPYAIEANLDIRAQSGWGAGWANYFTAANTVFPYYLGGSPAAPADWVANSMSIYCTPVGADALSFYPDINLGSTSTDPALPVKQAWGYQVAPSALYAVGTPADVPHIILKLTDVTYQNNVLGQTTQYVTVTKYKDADGNPVNQFVRGNVYRISNLEFTHDEATNQPYMQNLTITATVSVTPWLINNLTPDWR